MQSAIGGSRPGDKEDNRFVLPINANHKSMVKFGPNQFHEYIKVRQAFQRFVSDSRAAIVARFQNQSVEGKAHCCNLWLLLNAEIKLTTDRRRQREACRTSKGNYVFSELDDSPKYITCPMQGQNLSRWEHVTSESMDLYDQMYQECSDRDPRIGCE